MQESNKSKKQIIAGRKPVLEFLENGENVDRIFINRSINNSFSQEISRFCRERKIPLKRVPVEKLNKVFNGNHQGVLLYRSPIKYYSLEDMIPHIYSEGETPLFIVLDGITDIRNFGAICRTAWASGVHAIIIPQTDSVSIQTDAIKVSAGALNHLPICREKSIPEIMEILKQNGITIIGLDLKGSAPSEVLNSQNPIAIVMGSEGDGLHADTKAMADHLLRLPMKRDFDSYNVSVATGMVLYELMR